MGGSIYFITFRSLRGSLPQEALEQVRKTILHDHGRKYELILAAIMPDHVHLLLYPLRIQVGHWYDLSVIMKGIKGVSARRINQLLGTTGSVWQEESYDRIVRDEQELQEKVEYMYNNPVKAGLVQNPEDYRFFVYPEMLVGQTRVSGPPDS
jgi:REP element-mobilizing transposase RayT